MTFVQAIHVAELGIGALLAEDIIRLRREAESAGSPGDGGSGLPQGSVNEITTRTESGERHGK